MISNSLSPYLKLKMAGYLSYGAQLLEKTARYITPGNNEQPFITNQSDKVSADCTQKLTLEERLVEFKTNTLPTCSGSSDRPGQKLQVHGSHPEASTLPDRLSAYVDEMGLNETSHEFLRLFDADYERSKITGKLTMGKYWSSANEDQMNDILRYYKMLCKKNTDKTFPYMEAGSVEIHLKARLIVQDPKTCPAVLSGRVQNIENVLSRICVLNFLSSLAYDKLTKQRKQLRQSIYGDVQQCSNSEIEYQHKISEIFMSYECFYIDRFNKINNHLKPYSNKLDQIYRNLVLMCFRNHPISVLIESSFLLTSSTKLKGECRERQKKLLELMTVIVEKNIRFIVTNSELLSILVGLILQEKGSPTSHKEQQYFQYFQQKLAESLIITLQEMADDLVEKIQTLPISERVPGSTIFDEFCFFNKTVNIVIGKINTLLDCTLHINPLGKLADVQNLICVKPHLSNFFGKLNILNKYLLNHIDSSESFEPKDIVSKYFRGVHEITENPDMKLPDKVLNGFAIRPEYVFESLEYADYLITKYPSEDYCLACLGAQCVMTVGFLKLLLEEKYDNYVVCLPVKRFPKINKREDIIRYANEFIACLDKNSKSQRKLIHSLERMAQANEYLSERQFTELLDLIWKHILPTKEDINGRTLIISRSLLFAHTMGRYIDKIADYLNRNNIKHAFDFTINSNNYEDAIELKKKNSNVNIRLVSGSQLFTGGGFHVFYDEILNYNPYITSCVMDKIGNNWKENPDYQRLKHYLQRFLHKLSNAPAIPPMATDAGQGGSIRCMIVEIICLLIIPGR